MSGEPYSEQIFYLGRSAEPRSASGLLPADIADFTGRGEELALLEGLAGDSSAVVTAIEGPPGVGKTAVAVHAAFKLRDAFPDGRLYADLRGYTEGQQAAEASEVLAVFLWRLGSSSNELPADLDQQAGLFREHLSSRKMLIILDNVATAAQVRSLLPETGSSRVLVVTRLPRRAALAAAAAAAVAVAMFGLGAWSFTVMRESPIGGIHKAPPGVTRQTAPGRQPGA